MSWPAHTEFSDVMTESAQRHFAAVSQRFEEAMTATDVTRDALSGSFDLFMSRVAQRTNDTVRVLTVVSVSLLPAALMTGVMGMNFHPSFFDHPGVLLAHRGRDRRGRGGRAGHGPASSLGLAG